MASAFMSAPANRAKTEWPRGISCGKRRNGESEKKPIRHFRDLDVYQNALETGLRVYELSKKFPHDERYALTDQVRRSSRSVCANIAEAWRKRRYTAAFISKLSDSEGEAAETQVHIELAFRHGYIDHAEFQAIDDAYEHILGQLVRMVDQPEKWVIGGRKNT
jgi:four helix bundle protein